MADNETPNTVKVEMPSTLSITYSATGDEITFDVADLPVASVAFIFEYGLRQYGNDGAAIDKYERDDEGKHVMVDGKKVTRPESDVTDDKVAGVKARIDAIMAGVFKTGGGGRQLSPVENELRALVNSVLRKKGISGVDATKAAKKPSDAMAMLAAVKVKKDGKGNAETIANKALSTLKALAEANVAKNAAIDLEI